MKISIQSKTLSEEKWYPIFDVFLFYLEAKRHSFDPDKIEEILDSGWIKSKSKDDYDLVRRSFVSRSLDRYADKSTIRIDSSTLTGGRVDDDYTTSIHPQECLSFLSQPFSVIVENEWFDGAFLLWMARAIGRKDFIEAYRANKFVFRHAGGKGSLERSASVLSQGVWPSGNRPAKAMKLWACIILDNDAKFPAHKTNSTIIARSEPWVSFVHELEKRSIESYLTYTALLRYDKSPTFKDKVDALFRLSELQRKHYHMKIGFGYKNVPEPNQASYMAAQEILEGEKILFADIPSNDWAKLSSGFGRSLSEIYVKESLRPQAGDDLSMVTDDKNEIDLLIKAIYERI